MDRKAALVILGLNDKATSEDISKRVDMLVRKYKHTGKTAEGYTLEDVENASRILSGITYRDDKAEQEIKYRKEHPNPLFKLLKVDEEKARNFIYYHKWHAVIGLIVMAIVVSMVVSIVTRVEPDLKVLITGDVYLGDVTALETQVKTHIAGVIEPQIQNVYLGEDSDPQSQMAMQTKFTVEVAAGKNDIYILDKKTYLNLAKQGAFKPINEVLAGQGSIGIEDSELQQLKVAIELNDGKTYAPELYGLDVSDSPLLRDSGIIGESLIVAVGQMGVDTKNAVSFIRMLLD